MCNSSGSFKETGIPNALGLLGMRNHKLNAEGEIRVFQTKYRKGMLLCGNYLHGILTETRVSALKAMLMQHLCDLSALGCDAGI